MHREIKNDTSGGIMQIHPFRSISRSFLVILGAIFFTAAVSAQQRPGQLTVDYAAGEAPSIEEVAKVEAEVAALPDDHDLARTLG